MEYVEHIGTEGQADERIIRGDTEIITFNHRIDTDEYGAENHICSGYIVSHEELTGIENGHLPPGFAWDDTLHTIFRTYQHCRADKEYAYAQRMLRATNDAVWQNYIDSLDMWNASVSALADGFGTAVPDMPQKPILTSQDPISTETY